VPGQHLPLPGGGGSGPAVAAVAHPATVRRDQGGVTGPLAGCKAGPKTRLAGYFPSPEFTGWAAATVAEGAAVSRAPDTSSSHAAYVIA